MEKENILLQQLKQWQIPYTNHEHEPVFTVAEANACYSNIPGGHCKNLFLVPKKGPFVLVVMLDDRRLDMKAFRVEGISGRFSMAKSEDLWRTLQVVPGSVTPFGLMHKSSQGVVVVLDKDMMEHEYINFHPLQNDMTTTIRAADLLKFLELSGHKPQIIGLPKL